jgi:hypothetical protein
MYTNQLILNNYDYICFVKIFICNAKNTHIPYRFDFMR